MIEVKSSKSNLVKFDKFICKYCNNTFTQPFDYSYDNFINKVLSNTDEIVKSGKIDFNSIFDQNVFLNKYNVLKYYIKHFGCRLSTNSISISESLNDFIYDRREILTSLFIKFEINLDIFYTLSRLKKDDVWYSNLYKGGFWYQYAKNSNTEIDFTYTFYTNQWITIKFVYSDKVNEINYPWLTTYYLNNEFPINIKSSFTRDYLDQFTTEEIIYDLSSKSNDYQNSIELNGIVNEIMKNPFY